jgi:beta-mannosidase
VVDAHGRPKAAYYFVKRALRPRAIFFSDEGVNGLCVEVTNTPARPLQAKVEVTLWRSGSVQIAQGSVQLAVLAHGNAKVEAARLFDHFIDLTHAYRFGPPAYEVAVAQLRDAETNELLSESFYFPSGHALPRTDDLGLQASLHRVDEGYRVHLTTQNFAQAIAVEVPGYVPDDSYFHLAPGGEKWVALTEERSERARAPRGTVHPLNTHSAVRIVSA